MTNTTLPLAERVRRRIAELQDDMAHERSNTTFHRIDELEQVLSMIDKTADAWKAMSLKYVGDPDFDGCIVAGYGLLKKDD